MRREIGWRGEGALKLLLTGRCSNHRSFYCVADQLCLRSVTAGSIMSVQCQDGTSGGLSYQQVPWTQTVEMFSYDIAYSETVDYPEVTVVQTLSVYAPLLQMLYQSSDLPATSSASSRTSSSRTSSSMSSTSTSSGGTATSSAQSHGLSTGAAVGIGVGVGLGVLLAAAAGVWLWCTKRRRRPTSTLEGQAAEDQPAYAEGVDSNKPAETTAKESPTEAEGHHQPAELGAHHEVQAELE